MFDNVEQAFISLMSPLSEACSYLNCGDEKQKELAKKLEQLYASGLEAFERNIKEKVE